MSRVRILNLPKGCTEDQLRQHILSNVPPSAPPLQITDVFLKRGPSHAAKGNRPMKGQPNDIIRMAFVGFQTAAAGRFVVEHFHQTYFGSARLHVEPAQDVKKAREALEEREERRKRTRETKTEKDSKNEEKDENLNETSPAKKAKKEALSEVVETKNDERRKDFVAQRIGATVGASWTSELLLPNTEPPSEEPGPSLSTSGTHEVGERKKSKEKTEGKKSKVKGKDLGVENGLFNEEDENSEEAILKKQQALEKVSEMDFLAQLGGEVPKKDVLVSEEPKESTPIDSSLITPVGAEGVAKKEKKTKPSKKSEEEALRVAQEALAFETRRIRLSNIPYVATEQHIKQFITSQVGPIDSIHIPFTKDTRQSKGAAFVRFANPQDAVRALTDLHGSIFMGRLVKVSAAEEDPYQVRDAAPVGAFSSTAGPGETGAVRSGTESSSFKREKDEQRRKEEEDVMNQLTTGEAGTHAAPRSWNTLYLNSSAAVERVAQRMQLKSEDLVRVEAKGAATRAAIAEALLTSETQTVLGDEGISMEAIATSGTNLLRARSATTIIVKNLSLKSAETAQALSAMFSKFGVLEVSAFPASGLFALFRFSQAQDARVAFRRLSFKLFQGSPLYLEWAPVGSILEKDEEEEAATEEKTTADASEESTSTRLKAAAQTFVLFISNIPFKLKQTQEELHAFLLDACPRFGEQPEKYVKRVVLEKDKGRAFVTLDSQRSLLYAQRQWHGKILEGRTLSCVPSSSNVNPIVLDETEGSSQVPAKVIHTTEEENEDEQPLRTLHDRSQSGALNIPPGCDPLKIVVKNLPFEATETDVRTLFSAFTEVRSVRLPRKTSQFSHHRENHHRGFAFVEFLSESEAARALKALRATHLYGRHLVLEYAKLA